MKRLPLMRLLVLAAMLASFLVVELVLARNGQRALEAAAKARAEQAKNRPATATEMVQQAVKAMEGRVWRVDVENEGRSSSEIKKLVGEWKPCGTIKGLLQGKDFDLTSTGYPWNNVRWICLGRKEWATRDGGQTWGASVRNPDWFSEFMEIGPPLPISVEHLQFERVGSEQHEDGTWLHMKAVARGDEPMGERPLNYWILLDAKGAPVRVRWITAQYESGEMIAMQVEEFFYTVDITPAKEGEKVVPPTDPKAQADADAAVLKYDRDVAAAKAAKEAAGK